MADGVVTMDLQAAALHELAFIARVDARPALYKGPLAELAVERYLRLWMPLVANNRHTTAGAPLDIRWVWHCHLLCPRRYARDCRLFRVAGCEGPPEGFDHVLLSEALEAQARLSAARAWAVAYPDMPFELEEDALNGDPLALGVVKSLLDASSQGPAPAISYDVLAGMERQAAFFYQTSLPHYRNPAFLIGGADRYRRFLLLKQRNPTLFVVPTYDIDVLWHAHQLNHAAYARDTRALLAGEVLDHDDSVNDRETGSKLDREGRNTQREWASTYPEDSYFKPGGLYRGDAPLSKPAEGEPGHEFTRVVGRRIATIAVTGVALDWRGAPGRRAEIQLRAPSVHARFVPPARVIAAAVAASAPLPLSSGVTADEQLVGQLQSFNGVDPVSEIGCTESCDSKAPPVAHTIAVDAEYPTAGTLSARIRGHSRCCACGDLSTPILLQGAAMPFSGGWPAGHISMEVVDPHGGAPPARLSFDVRYDCPPSEASAPQAFLLEAVMPGAPSGGPPLPDGAITLARAVFSGEPALAVVPVPVAPTASTHFALAAIAPGGRAPVAQASLLTSNAIPELVAAPGVPYVDWLRGPGATECATAGLPPPHAVLLGTAGRDVGLLCGRWTGLVRGSVGNPGAAGVARVPGVRGRPGCLQLAFFPLGRPYVDHGWCIKPGEDTVGPDSVLGVTLLGEGGAPVAQIHLEASRLLVAKGHDAGVALAFTAGVAMLHAACRPDEAAAPIARAAGAAPRPSPPRLGALRAFRLNRPTVNVTAVGSPPTQGTVASAPYALGYVGGGYYGGGGCGGGASMAYLMVASSTVDYDARDARGQAGCGGCGACGGGGIGGGCGGGVAGSCGGGGGDGGGGDGGGGGCGGGGCGGGGCGGGGCGG